jgi:hypothetical protein
VREVFKRGISGTSKKLVLLAELVDQPHRCDLLRYPGPGASVARPTVSDSDEI